MSEQEGGEHDTGICLVGDYYSTDWIRYSINIFFLRSSNVSSEHVASAENGCIKMKMLGEKMFTKSEIAYFLSCAICSYPE